MKASDYHRKDCQGNNVALVDGTGAMLDTIAYYPYGQPIVFPATSSQAPAAGSQLASAGYLYGGKRYLQEGGISAHDFGPRLLPSAIPAWTRQDRLAEDYRGISPYAYCLGDPVNFVDPNGENALRIIDEEKKEITIKAHYFVVVGDLIYHDTFGSLRTLKGYTHDNLIEMQKYNDYLNGLKLKVEKGLYEGYLVQFDLTFEEIDCSGNASRGVELFKYQDIPIGNSIEVSNCMIRKTVNLAPVEDEYGYVHSAGGVTLNYNGIVMNESKNGPQVDELLLHEIFHTFMLTHPEKFGAKSGIFHYPPEKPNNKDANNLANNKLLPTIYVK